jgi:hypothetical protein
MKKIAVITVQYNHPDDTADFLSSLKSLDVSGLQVIKIVVDNASEQSAGIIVGKYPGTVWIQNGKNSGFSGGYNRGLKYAWEWGADYFLIINNDTLAGDSKLLKKLIKSLDDHPGAGVASPKIYFAPGYEYYKSRYSESQKGKVIWYAGGVFDWNNINTIHRGIDEIDTGKYDQVEEIDFITGCCFLISRSVLKKVGFFDEELALYYEDADYQMRIKKQGYTSLYCGNAYIFHKVSKSAGIGSPLTEFMTTRNRLYFGFRYASLKTKLAVVRQMIKMLLFGRPAQREGVTAYLDGESGLKSDVSPRSKLEYPLELSIVILNYKTTRLLLGLLKSIYDKRSGFYDVGGAEVLVLDNSPEESCAKDVLVLYPDIKFVGNLQNTGFSRGNNQLIDYSLGRYVLLLNSDIEVPKAGLQEFMSEAKKFGERVVCIPKLLFPDGSVQDSCFHLPTWWGAIKEYFLKIPGSYFMFTPKTTSPVQVEGGVMACFLIPSRVIGEIGNLNEETFIYFEDIEYCRRLKANNIPVYYLPGVEFVHHHGQASKKAGVGLSNQRLITASKWYHGWLNYQLVTLALKFGQKFGRVSTPQSRWKDNTN